MSFVAANTARFKKQRGIKELSKWIVNVDEMLVSRRKQVSKE